MSGALVQTLFLNKVCDNLTITHSIVNLSVRREQETREAKVEETAVKGSKKRRSRYQEMTVSVFICNILFSTNGSF